MATSAPYTGGFEASKVEAPLALDAATGPDNTTQNPRRGGDKPVAFRRRRGKRGKH